MNIIGSNMPQAERRVALPNHSGIEVKGVRTITAEELNNPSPDYAKLWKDLNSNRQADALKAMILHYGIVIRGESDTVMGGSLRATVVTTSRELKDPMGSVEAQYHHHMGLLVPDNLEEALLVEHPLRPGLAATQMTGVIELTLPNSMHLAIFSSRGKVKSY